MKNDWRIKPLGDLCEFQRGLTYSKSDEADVPGTVVLRAININLESNLLDLSELRFIKDGKSVPDSRKVKKDSLLICTASGSKSHLGKVAYIDKDYGYAFGGFMGLLTPKDGVKSRYLFHVMTSSDYKTFIRELTDGVNINNLRFDDLKRFPVPHPEGKEQERIVRVLDEAFEGIAVAIANADKNLRNARALFVNHLNSIFDRPGKHWVTKPVREIAQHSLGKMLDKAKNKGVPQPYLRNLNVRWFKFDISDLLQMPFLPSEEAKYTARKGDVMVCEGGYPGRAAIWDDDCPIHFQKAIHRVRFHEPEHSKWFVYYLYAKDARNELKAHFSGTGIQHFTGEALARFPVPVPPMEEIRRATACFEELQLTSQELESLFGQKLAALDELKKSLLHQAFTGRL